MTLVSPDDDIPGAAYFIGTNKSIYATNKITAVSFVEYSAGLDIGAGPTQAIHLNAGFEVGIGRNFHVDIAGFGVISAKDENTNSRTRRN